MSDVTLMAKNIAAMSRVLKMPICAGSTVECTCVVRGTNSITQWSYYSDAGLCDGNGIHLSQTPPCDGEGHG